MRVGIARVGVRASTVGVVVGATVGGLGVEVAAAGAAAQPTKSTNSTGPPRALGQGLFRIMMCSFPLMGKSFLCNVTDLYSIQQTVSPK